MWELIRLSEIFLIWFSEKEKENREDEIDIELKIF